MQPTTMVLLYFNSRVFSNSSHSFGKGGRHRPQLLRYHFKYDTVSGRHQIERRPRWGKDRRQVVESFRRCLMFSSCGINFFCHIVH